MLLTTSEGMREHDHLFQGNNGYFSMNFGKKKGISLTNRNFDKEVKKKILANKSYFRITHNLREKEIILILMGTLKKIKDQ